MPRRVLLSRAHQSLIRENFNLLDSDKDGKLQREEVILMLRALGQTVSNREVEEIVDRVLPKAATHVPPPPPVNSKNGQALSGEQTPKAESPPAPPGLTLKEVLNLLQDSYEEPIVEETLIEAFQLFDKRNCGKLKSSDLIALLTSATTGTEPLPLEEAREIAKLAAIADGELEYKELARKLTAGPEAQFVGTLEPPGLDTS